MKWVAHDHCRAPESLSIFALRSLSSRTLCSLDSYLLSLLIPYPIQLALRRFQKRVLPYIRWKMERESFILALFENARHEALLEPNNCDRFSIRDGTFISGYLSLRPGDHIAVFLGHFYHHGIYLPNHQVADVDQGRQRALDIVPFDKFLHGQQNFGVVHYNLPEGQDIDEFHRVTLEIVEYMLHQT